MSDFNMEADTFMPCIRRSDGVLFSMETIVDMKALGFDTEAELQNPAAKGEPITKRYEGGKLRFFDHTGKELFPRKSMVVNVPKQVLDRIENV
jgi:hypothetical protein